jgi:predicted O-methyltransferase YrrM
MLQQIIRFVKYYFRAETRYNVHSPFVFQFVENVLEDDRWFYAFSEIEAYRNWLKANPELVEITDFGAGSQVSPNNIRSLASLAKYSANRPYACQLLFRLIQFYKPKTLLELGTSLGISTAYQASAALDSRMVTIEGCPNVAHHAAGTFRFLKVKNVALLEGRFDEMLPVAFEELKKLDYVFVDGNHRKEPTLRYFEKCLEHAHQGSIFVFDDIHWSAGMEEAWAEIKAHPKVKVTIDLFFFGVVFFREEQQVKEHFTLVRYLWKPWKIGFFDLFR